MTDEPTFQDHYCRTRISVALIDGGARNGMDLLTSVITCVRDIKSANGLHLTMADAFLFAGESPELVETVVRTLRADRPEHFFLK